MEKLTRQQLEVKKKGLEQELEKLKKDKAQAVSHTEGLSGGIFRKDSENRSGSRIYSSRSESGAANRRNGTEEIPAEQENPFQEEESGETDQGDSSESGNSSGAGELLNPEEPEDPGSAVIPSDPEMPESPLDPETPLWIRGT